eukprot:scaffold5806_cov209-Skeletonema_marinoi.AAC.1
MQMSLLVYLAFVVGVSPVVLWWNEAKQLVYMALVVRVSPVILCWKRGRLVYMALVRLVISGNTSRCVLLCGSFGASLWRCYGL